MTSVPLRIALAFVVTLSIGVRLVAESVEQRLLQREIHQLESARSEANLRRADALAALQQDIVSACAARRARLANEGSEAEDSEASAP